VRLRTSVFRFTAAFAALAVFLYWPAIILACAVDGATAYQPYVNEMTEAFHQAGSGTLGPGYPSLPLIETGAGTQPGSVPCVILKAVAFVESSWRQAENTDRGSYGPALVSSCGYGVMQITSGMGTPAGPDNQPSSDQYNIATDYKFNIGWGAKMLVEKWNLGDYWEATIGDRNPAIAENWYYAVWAYNYYGWPNNPNNPNFPWPRPAFDGSQSRTNYPYQELVWGYAAYPPSIGGVQLWDPVPLTLPERSSITNPPGWIPTPQPFNQSPCPTSQPTLQVSPQAVGFLLTPWQLSAPVPVQITSSGSPLDWSAQVPPSATWLMLSATSGTTPATVLQVRANTAELTPGQYNATITISAPGASGSPKTIQVGLAVVSEVKRQYLPQINNSS